MIDMRKTIIPKSDQLNADDLIDSTLTIRVTKVSSSSTPDQPISISFEGDNGKPYKPCKSMRRVLVKVWGSDGAGYVGRQMTLFRDDKVLFGGVAVGGIRISHMSHLDAPMTMALTAAKASRKPYTVKPLMIADAVPPAQISVEELRAHGIAAAQGGRDNFMAWYNGVDIKPLWNSIKPFMEEFQKTVEASTAVVGDKNEG